jgi:hypothetical protein
MKSRWTALREGFHTIKVGRRQDRRTPIDEGTEQGLREGCTLVGIRPSADLVDEHKHSGT